MSDALLQAYRRALEAGGGLVRDEPPDIRHLTELEWQARWFAGDYGREWSSEDGAPVRIEDFGRWNRESGPDFVDTRVRIGSVIKQGSVELDFDVRDWERHGHATNPAFRETVLHVFTQRPEARFFTRTCDHREVAQVHLPAPSRSASSEPTALSIPVLDARATILQAAARHRLDLKGSAIARHAAVHGEDEAWFSALAVALGYKSNQTPFLLLAQRVGLRAATKVEGEAMLFGLAGFLESPTPPEADKSVRTYLRILWENWWATRASCERLILPPSSWKTHGLRPANHPHRRVAALARVAHDWRSVADALSGPSSDPLRKTLEKVAHPFWDTRFNLQSALLTTPQALIGADRIRDILINIYYPLAVSRDPATWSLYLQEKAPAPAMVMKHAALRFFGDSGRSRGFLASAVAQQGLLQLERDYLAAADPVAFVHALQQIPPALDGAPSLR